MYFRGTVAALLTKRVGLGRENILGRENHTDFKKACCSRKNCSALRSLTATTCHPCALSLQKSKSTHRRRSSRGLLRTCKPLCSLSVTAAHVWNATISIETSLEARDGHRVTRPSHGTGSTSVAHNIPLTANPTLQEWTSACLLFERQ